VVSASELPRWRGFNLQPWFRADKRRPFREDDFRLMSEWGFDFARLPLDYRCWVRDGDPFDIQEDAFDEIDRVLGFGRRWDVHVCLNFHRAPGYTVASTGEKEKLNVWQDEDAVRACELHWRALADRYAGVPSERLSFNPFNEPPAPGSKGYTREAYRRIIRRLADAVWEVDPDRLIICDGDAYGRKPVPELADLGVAQSTRAYEPLRLTHYKAWWVGGEDWPEPEWPGEFAGERWDKQALRDYWQPWRELADSGVGVHCGEGGAFSAVPHEVALAWLEDALSVLDECGFGWALWHLRGSFGILDSERDDVDYEPCEGGELDRRMLDVLRRH
jgi:endoglucanase